MNFGVQQVILLLQVTLTCSYLPFIRFNHSSSMKQQTHCKHSHISWHNQSSSKKNWLTNFAMKVGVDFYGSHKKLLPVNEQASMVWWLFFSARLLFLACFICIVLIVIHVCCACSMVLHQVFDGRNLCKFLGQDSWACVTPIFTIYFYCLLDKLSFAFLFILFLYVCAYFMYRILCAASWRNKRWWWW